MVQNSINIIKIWDSTAKHIELWEFYAIFLRDPEHYLPTMDMDYLIEEIFSNSRNKLNNILPSLPTFCDECNLHSMIASYMCWRGITR